MVITDLTLSDNADCSVSNKTSQELEATRDEDAILDSAEYLFKNRKYQDCHLTVGAPDSEDVETIGVSVVHLVSQSTVFRDMLSDSLLADPSGSNTHITDVSPAVFKLMLRHVYNGRLPEMSRETAAQLLFCADKYNLKSLFECTETLLVPKTVEEVFPALQCVAYINVPNLLPHVTKMVQEQTDKVVGSQQFLQVDGRCLEFIAQQETLSISELELWRSLIRWVKAKTDITTEQRSLLTKPLQYVRFLTFSADALVKEVLNSKIVNQHETMEILLAISNNTNLDLSGFSPVKSVRGLFVSPLTGRVFSNSFPYRWSYEDSLLEIDYFDEIINSNFTMYIKSEDIVLQCLVFQTKRYNNERIQYNYACNIEITSFDFKNIMDPVVIQHQGRVVCGEDFLMNLFLEDNKPLLLRSKLRYNISLLFTEPHPVFKALQKHPNGETDVTNVMDENDYFTFKYNTPFHVVQIAFKTK